MEIERNKEKSKKRIHVFKVVFEKESNKPVLWKDLKDFKLQDRDQISAGFEDFDHEMNVGNFYYLRVWREVLETDEEYKKRQEKLELDEKWAKQRRYESYLHLKKEFENQDGNEEISTRG